MRIRTGTIFAVVALVVLVGEMPCCGKDQHSAVDDGSNGTAETKLVIDRLLILLQQAESSGNPTAFNNGAVGLFQITIPVLQEYNQHHHTNHTMDDLFDPAFNTTVATWYLYRLNRWLTKHGFPDDTVRIALAYNWGMSNLANNGFQVPTWAKFHRNQIYRSIFRGQIQ